MLAVSVTVLAPELEGLGQRAQDPLGHALGPRRDRLLEQEGELVAAEPAGAVLGTQHAAAGWHPPAAAARRRPRGRACR